MSKITNLLLESDITQEIKKNAVHIMDEITRLKTTSPPKLNKNLTALSKEIETTFFTTFLKASGIEMVNKTFNGGVGEAQFSSFLTREYASIIAENSQTGLAQHIYKALITNGENHEHSKRS